MQGKKRSSYPAIRHECDVAQRFDFLRCKVKDVRLWHSRMKSFALAFLLSLVAVPGIAESAETPKLTIVIIGDSTVCNYPPQSPSRGWGQFIAEHFKDTVRVANHAASGRSTKTFIAEGRWKRALEEKPDFVLIQFGHNDSHAKERPEATDAATDYRDFLRRYVDESRAAHATPIFITPMHRRNFNADGKLQDILQPYADAMKTVAAEKKVPVIDLHASSGALFHELEKTAAPNSQTRRPTSRTSTRKARARWPNS